MELLRIVLLLVVLLNPFMLTVYLMDVLRTLPRGQRWRVLMRAGAISSSVFCLFGWGGDAVFSVVLQARFAAFLMFGGILFLIIAIRYVLGGAETVKQLAGGAPQRIAGAIAMPFMIGPGTVSASVLAGVRLQPPMMVLSLVLAVTIAMVVCGLMLELLARLETRNSQLVERYSDIVGRISALVIGTIAVEMIFRAFEMWQDRA